MTLATKTPINDAFERYVSGMPGELPAKAQFLLRTAFFTGAASMFEAMLSGADDGKPEDAPITDEETEYLDDIEAELRGFKAELKAVVDNRKHGAGH